MKRLFTLASAVVLTAGLAGCPAASVHTDYDHTANFSQFKTFSFARVQTDNPLYEQRIKDEVSKDLESKGLQMTSSGGDLEVTAVGASHQRQYYRTFYDGPRFGYYYGGFGLGSQTTQVVNYKVGTLVLDMYNNQSKQLVWRGTASRSLSSSPEEKTSNLYAAIDKMLSDFPPK